MIHRCFVHILLLLAISVVCYLNCLNNSFVWDDINNIVNNERLSQTEGWREIFLRPSGGLQAGFYRPLPYLSIKLDHLLSGKTPGGYHLTNVVFHLLNVILVFHLARRLTKSDKTALFCGALFAAHPVHTEAVTYVSGRSDPVCAFFLLFSFLVYLNFLHGDGFRRKSYLTGSLFLFLLALISKEPALVFPFLILGYHVCFQNASYGQGLKTAVPFILVAAVFLLFREFLVEGALLPVEKGDVTIFFKSLLFNLWLLVLPVNLHMQHAISENNMLHSMPFWLSLAAVIVIISAILRFLRKGYVPFGLFWFIIGVLPFLGILKLNAGVAEHWLYLPSFGLFLLVGGLFSQAKSKVVTSVIFPAIVVVLSIATIRQNNVWSDDITLYKYTLRYHVNNPKLHYNLGNAYLRREMLDEAEEEYRIALELNPDYAYSLNNLGIALERGKTFREARQLYGKANALDPELNQTRGNVSDQSASLSTAGIRFVAPAYAQEKEMTFDHALYGEVLEKYVEDGMVDYKGLKNDRSLLHRYLAKVAALDPEVLNSMSDNEKLAFYFNTYNALTLKVIIEHYPVRSIRDIPNVWDKMQFTVAREKTTLDHIEHQILRKKFKEPLIHFALVCASKSCATLRGEPYTGGNIYEVLEKQAHLFMNDMTKNRLDRERKTLYLSSYFKWFREDFGDVIAFVSKYFPEDDVKFIQGGKVRIKYLKYDWSLNEKGS